ncbi:MAG: PDZ domain-containing protein [Deltaproteobacteria bacterium]
MATRIAIASTLLCSCASIPMKGESLPGPTIPVRVVAVYPVGLRWSAPAYRSYELAMDEVRELLVLGRYSVLGPTELEVLDSHSDSIYAATNLASSLAERRLRPNDLVALRGWVERRETNDTELLVDQRGKPVGQRRNLDLRLVIHEELIGPTPGSILAEVSAEVPVDPFADHPSWDDMPELRGWVRKLVRRLFDLASARLADTPKAVIDTGLDLSLNPRDEDAFVADGHPALDVLLARLGPVDREAALLDRILYFEPSAPPARAGLFSRLPQGLYVDHVRSPAAKASGIRAGDLIVEIEGEPAAGEQTLRRWMTINGAGQSVRVVVLRDGARKTLALPCPVH